MRKSFIVENVEANLDKITCLTDEIKEGIEFRCLNAEGIWHTEGRSNDALEVDLWNKVERYIGVPLARLEYCKNRPHALTAFK